MTMREIRSFRKGDIMRLAVRIGTCLLMVACLARPGAARLKYIDGENTTISDKHQLTKSAQVPNTILRTHNVGNFYLSVTNWGFFGSQDREFCDDVTGLCVGAEFPAGSSIDYLFQGALWISAIRGIDTLTSTGHDGWQHIAEMYPETIENGGIIRELTNRPGNPNFSEDAVSEQDFIAEYTDTLTDQAYVSPDPFTGPHVPLGLKIIQKSYAWSYSYAQDFVLLDFTIKNIGEDSLSKLYMGVYIDADVYHASTLNGFQDDICGFRETVPSLSGAIPCGESEPAQDTINIAWISDNDGDPSGGVFDYRSPKAVTGTRVVRSPTPPGGCGPRPIDYSFNWWNSHGQTNLDWGPQRLPGDRNISGGLGTPDGDAHKYRYMSNNEFDYDQVFSAQDFSDEGWLPPHESQARTFADGYDTRYLLSFGPFEIGVADSLQVTIGYVAGEDFHLKPDNAENLPDDPWTFNDNIDFTDLAVNARWAAWVFDNPGISTPDPITGVADECRGLRYLANCQDSVIGDSVVCYGCDTVWYAGDGIPDYSGPPPPQSPKLHITTLPGQVEIEWYGSTTELTADPFSFLNDFEGYRVYMGDMNQVNSFALIASWDIVDFRPFREDMTAQIGSDDRWVYKDHPLTLEELRTLFDDPDFDPTQYPNKENPFTHYTAEGSQRYYFEKEDWNRGNTYMEHGVEVENPIERVALIDSVDEATNDTLQYGKYRFTIDNLLPSESYYFAVTAFDFGFPQNDLEPLESSPMVNSERAFPAYSAAVAESLGLEVSVYPNPYKISANYRGRQYEDPNREGWTERDRRIHFVNLPSEATIKIFSLDGDLVREIEHYEGAPFSHTDSKAYWDLISKNTQAVVSGIYLYTIESEQGTDIGKLVIIK